MASRDSFVCRIRNLFKEKWGEKFFFRHSLAIAFITERGAWTSTGNIPAFDAELEASETAEEEVDDEGEARVKINAVVNFARIQFSPLPSFHSGSQSRNSRKISNVHNSIGCRPGGCCGGGKWWSRLL